MCVYVCVCVRVSARARQRFSLCANVCVCVRARAREQAGKRAFIGGVGISDGTAVRPLGADDGPSARGCQRIRGRTRRRSLAQLRRRCGGSKPAASQCRCCAGERSPGADVASGRAQSRCRCGTGEPRPGSDVAKGRRQHLGGRLAGVRGATRGRLGGSAAVRLCRWTPRCSCRGRLGLGCHR